MLVSGSVDVIRAVSKGTLNFMNMAIKPSSQIWFYMLQIWDDESDRSQSFGEIDSQEVKQKYKYTAALLHPRSADSHTHISWCINQDKLLICPLSLANLKLFKTTTHWRSQFFNLRHGNHMPKSSVGWSPTTASTKQPRLTLIAGTEFVDPHPKTEVYPTLNDSPTFSCHIYEGILSFGVLNRKTNCYYRIYWVDDHPQR